MVGNAIRRTISKAKLMAKVKSPQIKMVVAAVGVVGGVVWACKATLKAKDIVDKYEEDKAEIEASEGSTDPHAGSLAKRNIKLLGELGLCYAGPVAVIVGSFGFAYSGFNELNKRYLGAVATASGFQKLLYEYRKKVADKIGADKEADLYHGITRKDIQTIDEQGNIDKVKKAPVVDDHTYFSPMTILFEAYNANTRRGSRMFEKNRNDLNLIALKTACINANTRLQNDGFMSVYTFMKDFLRMDPESLSDPMMAFCWGWKYTPHNDDPDSDNYIDIGIWDAYGRLKDDEAIDFCYYGAKDIFLEMNATPLFKIDDSYENKLNGMFVGVGG